MRHARRCTGASVLSWRWEGHPRRWPRQPGAQVKGLLRRQLEEVSDAAAHRHAGLNTGGASLLSVSSQCFLCEYTGTVHRAVVRDVESRRCLLELDRQVLI